MNLQRWAIQWRQDNWLDGKTSHLVIDREIRNSFTLKITGMPKLFFTRREASIWNERQYGYIKYRDDLRGEPHGWKMPRVVKVNISIEVVK